jgi:hypothetical protein
MRWQDKVGLFPRIVLAPILRVNDSAPKAGEIGRQHSNVRLGGPIVTSSVARWRKIGIWLVRVQLLPLFGIPFLETEQKTI